MCIFNQKNKLLLQKAPYKTLQDLSELKTKSLLLSPTLTLLYTVMQKASVLSPQLAG